MSIAVRFRCLLSRRDTCHSELTTRVTETHVVGPERYVSGQANDITEKAKTIQDCINACNATPNCCGGNLDLKAAARGSIAACQLLIKPAADTVCTPDEFFVGTTNAENRASFF